MRNQVFIQEQHLDEAVRRKVITQEQAENVASIARSMQPQGAVADLGWLTGIQSLLIAGMVGVPGLLMLDRMNRTPSGETLTYSVIAVVGLAVLSTLIRRFGLGKQPAAIAAAGAAMWSFGIGVSLYALLFAPHAFGPSYYNYGYSSLESVDYLANRASRDMAVLFGFVSVVGFSGLFGLLLRAPTTAGIATGASIAGVVVACESWSRAHGSRFSERDMPPVLVLGALALIGAAFALQRAMKSSRHDAAFWVHSVGVLPLGLAAAISIDKEAATTPFWLMLAAGVCLFGVKLERRSYVVAGAAALLFLPAFGAAEARLGDIAIGGALTLSTMLVAGVVFGLRRYYADRPSAPNAAIEQSVWG